MTDAPAIWRPYDRTPVPPSEQGRELVRVASDPLYFLGRYWPCNVPEAGGTMHFGVSGPWAAMGFMAICCWDFPGHVVVNKSRGWGLSTLLQGLNAYECAYYPGTRNGVGSRNDDQAKYFLRELIASLRTLRDVHPWLMPAFEPREHRVVFHFGQKDGSVESELHSVPHSADTASGMNFHRFTADELAKWEYDREAWSSILPAVGGRGGYIWAPSTPRAGTLHEREVIKAGQFADPLPHEDPWWPGKINAATGEPIPFPRRQWMRRFAERIGFDGLRATQPYPVSPQNSFLLLNPHYSNYPFRDEAWATERFKELGEDIQAFCENYELSADAASRHVFDINAITACEALPMAHSPLPCDGYFRKGWSYSIGADPSEGLAHGDHTAMIAGGLSPDGRHACIAKWVDGAINETEAAHLAAQWITEAINAGVRQVVFVPEANKSAMLAVFLQCYPEMTSAVIRHEDALAAYNRPDEATGKLGTGRSKLEGRLGVMTTTTTKRQIAGVGQQLLLAGVIPIPAIPALRYQIRRFQFQSKAESRTVKMQAPSGEKDDLVMAWLFMLVGLVAIDPSLLRRGLRPLTPEIVQRPVSAYDDESGDDDRDDDERRPRDLWTPPDDFLTGRRPFEGL